MACPRGRARYAAPDMMVHMQILRVLLWPACIALASAAIAQPAPAPQAQPAPSAQAPAAPEASRALGGPYELSNADRDRSCIITLAGDAAATRGRIEVAANCAEQFPFARGMALWSLGPADELRLQDSQGRLLIQFTEVEAGIFEGDKDGLHFLQNAAAAIANEVTARDIVGDWSIVGGPAQTVICRVNFAPAPDGQVLNPVRTAPGCDAQVTRFSLASWRIERGQLVVSSTRGQSWRFDRDSGTVWRRVPDAAQPLSLVKGDPEKP